MPCDTVFKRKQTIQKRISEVRDVVKNKFDVGLVSGRVKAKIGPQGGIAFEGLSEAERDGVTDLCAYRRLMVDGSASARMAIARAEQLAGRGVSKQAIAQGWHAHDGVWHQGH